MQIDNNITSFNVWQNYSGNVTNLRQSMGKLSSGSRINNAGEDPSGLAMSERLRTQARNTAAASRNVENKINYQLTADSWAQKIHDMLGRMDELAVMANDGTKSQVDREMLQKEFTQMQNEIARITDGPGAAAKFNGEPIFAGQAVSQQIGPDESQVFNSSEIDLQKSSPDVVGASTWGELIDSAAGVVSIADQADAGEAIGVVQAGIDYMSDKRSHIGAELKRMEQTLDGLRSYEENIRATESRIRDVDVARETAEMGKYNILQQVGTAMLAQANQVPQGVLQLFQ
jgi:flagellin